MTLRKLFACTVAAALALACGDPVATERPTPGGGGNSGGGDTPESPSFPELGKAEVGEPLPAWTEGALDIHFISTGRGESSYYILPDGTTMLVDVAGSLVHVRQPDWGSDATEAKPSWDYSCGEVILKYINNFTPERSRGAVDYFLLTHYHSDHYGGYSSALPWGGSGKDFQLSSFGEVVTGLSIKRAFDRNYPTTTFPQNLTSNEYKNYSSILKWSALNKGTKPEAFKVGALNQIALVADAGKFSNFSIRNVAGNGSVWTGVDEGSTTQMPASFSDVADDQIPGENTFSCAFWLKYGDFDLYAGGDLEYRTSTTEPVYFNVEGLASKTLRHVEVMKASHHGAHNANGDEMLKVLTPDQWIVNVWRDSQPNKNAVARVWKSSPDCCIYCTSVGPTHRETLTAAGHLEKFKSLDGHIVVRVAPGGSKYYVYILEDGDFSYKVNKIFGPFFSTSRK